MPGEQFHQSFKLLSFWKTILLKIEPGKQSFFVNFFKELHSQTKNTQKLLKHTMFVNEIIGKNKKGGI